jgi:hypothetical protein
MAETFVAPDGDYEIIYLTGYHGKGTVEVVVIRYQVQVP